MQIEKFSYWADMHEFINPVIKKERKLYGKKSLKRSATGHLIYTFISKEGRIIHIECNKSGKIISTSGMKEVYELEF